LGYNHVKDDVKGGLKGKRRKITGKKGESNSTNLEEGKRRTAMEKATLIKDVRKATFKAERNFAEGPKLIEKSGREKKAERQVRPSGYSLPIKPLGGGGCGGKIYF